MQAGFVPNSHMGTNLEVNYDNPPDKSYAQAVFDQSLNQLEGVNEPDFAYKPIWEYAGQRSEF